MIKFLPLSILFAFLSLHLSAQEISGNKDFKISTGIGLASATKNAKSPGIDLWTAFDYKIAKHFSITMEFEQMNYKQPGYDTAPPNIPNEIKVYDNNFSLLAKYHFPATNKLNFALGCGWTFCVKQSDYFIYEKDSLNQSWLRNVSSFSSYKIPFMGEASYAISKKLGVIARAKYNLDIEGYGYAYSVSIGLSLKL